MRWVLLRGLTRDARHWGTLPADLAAQSEEPVLALDLPGNGARHGERSPPEVTRMAEDAARSVPATEPVLLVAMSLGAMVALEWARIAPERIAGCVLINTSAGGSSPFWQRLRPPNYATLAAMLLPGRSPLERETAVLRMTSARAGDLAHLPQQWASFARNTPVTRGNAVRQLWAAARYRAPVQPPAVPLLLLVSRGDRLVSPDCSHRLARRWNLPLREHRWAGHDLPLDDPSWVLQVLAEWRRTLRP